jgi:hypothetical protein
MSTMQSKPEPIHSGEHGTQPTSSSKSAGATVIELGIALVRAESTAIPGQCSYCRSPRNHRHSTAQFSTVFCSKECEQEFIRAALPSLTVEDCIRIQASLERLTFGVEAAAV